MPFSPSEERRVARVESDVEAIYELLGEIQQTQASHTRHFRQLDKRLDSHDARFDSHDARFDQLDARFDQLDATLAEVLRRLPEA